MNLNIAKKKGHVSEIIRARGKIIPVHPKIIHGRLFNQTSTKIIPDIYEIKYRQNKKGHMSKIIPGQGKLIPLHQKIIHGS